MHSLKSWSTSSRLFCDRSRPKQRYCPTSNT